MTTTEELREHTMDLLAQEVRGQINHAGEMAVEKVQGLMCQVVAGRKCKVELDLSFGGAETHTFQITFWEKIDGTVEIVSIH